MELESNGKMRNTSLGVSSFSSTQHCKLALPGLATSSRASRQGSDTGLKPLQ